LQAAFGKLEQPPAMKKLSSVAKFAIVAAIVRSHSLGPIAGFWNSVLRGRDDFSDFGVRALSTASANVARRMILRWRAITAVRRSNAARLTEALSEIDGLTLPAQDCAVEPVCLRLPLIVENPIARDKIFAELRSSGINSSLLYERHSFESLRALTASSERFPRTEYLVDRIISLPTHAFIRERDIQAIIAAFDRVLGSTRVTEVGAGRAAGLAHQ